MDKGEIKKWMKAELQADPDIYLDCDGTVLLTQLGEAYANTFDLPEDIPDEVWDAAFEVGKWYARSVA